jgi:predicted DNA-binding helix-hairpin-helix protein
MVKLIEGSAFDVCHARCSYDASKLVYRAKAGKKTVNLLKILISTRCHYDCSYCPNPWRRGIEATPEQIAELFRAMKEKGLVEGAFISSSMSGESHEVMEKILRCGELIREFHRGYLHLKIVPGADREHIKRAVELASRVSINIETTSESRLGELSSVKNLKTDILRRERWIADEVERARKEGLKRGHTTQVIVGLGESDEEIVRVMNEHYEKFGVSRFYLSPFRPVRGTPLESERAERRERVARLYAADALLRLYGYDLKLLSLAIEDGFIRRDPKMAIADAMMDRGIELNPVNLPGIGLKSAQLIEEGYNFIQLKRMGFTLKRTAAYMKGQTRLQDFF